MNDNLSKFRLAPIVVLLLIIQVGFAGQIVHTGTASSNILVVVVETEDGEATPSQDVILWKVNDFSPSIVGRYSCVWYEEKAQWPGYPMSLRHHMYLRLENNFSNDTVYNIDTPYGAVSFTYNDRTCLCESIKINQVGYFGKSHVRYANLGIYAGDLGPQKPAVAPAFEVINEQSGQVIHTGMAEYWGDDTDPSPTDIKKCGSGEHVYRLDLSGLAEGGPYFISIPGYGRSYTFGVGEDYTKRIAYIQTRGLYHQRCGIALEEPYTTFTRGACHTSVEVTDADPPDFIKLRGPKTDIHGGYHDAGDFDRRFGHTLIPAWMLTIYEAFPEHFADKQYNLPESGNGIPDWLDEALWGLLVWEYLQDDNGGIRGGTEADRHPEYGVVNAETDKLIYRTYRIYGHTTAVGAGLFAQAARLLRPFDPGRADSLQNRAVRAWNYMKDHTLETAHAAQKMYAALQLYLNTGEAEYHTAFKNYAAYLLNNPGWPQQYNPTWWNLNTIKDGMIFTPYFFSYLISENETDQTIRDGFTNLLKSAANSQLTVLNSQPYPLGDAPNLAWGTATNQGRYAEPMILMYRLSGEQKYLDGVSQLADYALGLNPLGKSYVTGLGENRPNNPLHLDSYFTCKKGIGNVPGIVIYGPVASPGSEDYTKVVWEKVYPEWQTLPEQKRYTEGWSLVVANEFTTWETMALNVCMHGFLSSFYEPDTVTSGIKKNGLNNRPEIFQLWQNFPNPFNPTTFIRFELFSQSRVTLSVYNIRGEMIRTLTDKTLAAGFHNVLWDGLDEIGHTAASGLYFYRLRAGDIIKSKRMVLIR
ncbi:glycoside hydrolase family 9 protein [candidate division KSB1 bacterium]|nr:glycoside hydrolase family 9 protein [candidate division KSB1 bacterium]